MSCNNNELNSPYGDLQEPRPQHSTFSYDDRSNTIGDEESRGLIKSPHTSPAKPESESELAMAVVDILSCCDGRMNINQAKMLRDMESRFQENGNLISGEEERELFSDEESILKKLSPMKWLRGFSYSQDKYVTRSSQFISEQLPAKKSSSLYGKDRQKKNACLVASIGIVLIIAIVISITSLLANGNTPIRPPTIQMDTLVSPYSSDCNVVAQQEHPNPLSQCECGGSIYMMSDQARKKYNTLLYAFGAEYLHANETMGSCSSRNQALVWLAEDEGSTLSEVLIQRHTLVLFFIKLNGLFWTFEGHQKWMTSRHECTWFGITCNENKEVTGIELWNLNLEGSIPKEIMSLTHLERLSLPENKIRGHLPVDAFVMMPKLTDLTLFMNSISGPIDPRVLVSVPRLKTLNLDSNSLTGPLPTEVGKLVDLQQLKVCKPSDIKLILCERVPMYN